MRPGSILLTWPKAPLTENCFQAAHVGSLQHLSIGDPILPFDLQYALQAPHVEVVELLFMPS